MFLTTCDSEKQRETYVWNGFILHFLCTHVKCNCIDGFIHVRLHLVPEMGLFYIHCCGWHSSGSNEIGIPTRRWMQFLLSDTLLPFDSPPSFDSGRNPKRGTPFLFWGRENRYEFRHSCSRREATIVQCELIFTRTLPLISSRILTISTTATSTSSTSLFFHKLICRSMGCSFPFHWSLLLLFMRWCTGGERRSPLVVTLWYSDAQMIISARSTESEWGQFEESRLERYESLLRMTNSL